MKIFQKFGFGLVFILTFTVSAIAQTEKSAVSNKVASINSEMFENKEKGIKELVDAYAKLSDEFKPQNDELIAMSNKYIELQKKLEELNKLMNSGGVGLCFESVEGKIKELQDLENKIKAFQTSANRMYIKRESKVITPIKNKITEAITQFAKEKGYEAIIDLSKLNIYVPLDKNIVVDKNIVDVSKEFIKYYNSLAAKQQ